MHHALHGILTIQSSTIELRSHLMRSADNESAPMNCILSYFCVGVVGFEPTKPKATDLLNITDSNC